MRKRHFLVALAATSLAALGPVVLVSACSDTPTEGEPDSASTPTATTTATTTATSAPSTEPTTQPDSAALDASKADRAVPADLKAKIGAYDAALAKAVCAKITTCCSDADIEAYGAQFKEAPYKVTTPITAQSCEAVLKQSFDALYLAKWGVSTSVGNIVFDEAKGSACVAKVSAATCGGALTSALFDGTCFGLRGNEVFRKVGAVGAACDDIGDTTFIGECDPALGYCNEQKKCTAWRKTNESCGVLVQDSGPIVRLFCAPGTNCDGASPRNAGKCSAAPRTVALGENCTSNTGPDLVCPAGAYCDLFGTRVCETKKPTGTVCVYDEECLETRAFSCFRSTGDAGPSEAGDGGPETRTCGSTAYCGGR